MVQTQKLARFTLLAIYFGNNDKYTRAADAARRKKQDEIIEDLKNGQCSLMVCLNTLARNFSDDLEENLEAVLIDDDDLDENGNYPDGCDNDDEEDEEDEDDDSDDEKEDEECFLGEETFSAFFNKQGMQFNSL